MPVLMICLRLRLAVFFHPLQNGGNCEKFPYVFSTSRPRTCSWSCAVGCRVVGL